MQYMIKSIAMLKKQGFLIGIGLITAGFAAGFLLLSIIMYFSKSETIVTLGTMFSMMVLVIYTIFVGVLLFVQNFNLAVTSGRTRKSFAAAYVIVGVVMNLMMFLWIKVLYFIELFLSDKLFPGIPQEISMKPGLRVYLLFLYAVTIMIVQIFAGAMILKYGKRATIVLWLLWMAGCLLPGWISDMVKEKSSSILGQAIITIAKICTKTNVMGWTIFGCAAVVIAIVITLRCITKQQVNL